MLLLHGPINEIHKIVFDEITEDLIQRTAIRTKAVAGLSKFDADNWRRILGSNVLGNHSLELQRSLARITEKLCSKKLGCHERPIGIGEVLRGIIGKAVMPVVKKEVVQAAGSIQVCAGQVTGVESAVHNMVDLLESDNSAPILQADATNVFNNLSRNVFLHNIKVICPEISNFVINCYTLPSRLFVRGKRELKLKEGTT